MTETRTLQELIDLTPTSPEAPHIDRLEHTAPIELYRNSWRHGWAEGYRAALVALSRRVEGQPEETNDGAGLIHHAIPDMEGTEPRLSTLERAAALYRALNAYPVPRVETEDDGAIGLDWDEGSDRVLTVTLDQQPEIGYAYLVGEYKGYGRIAPKFAVSVIEEVLRLIYPQAGATGVMTSPDPRALLARINLLDYHIKRGLLFPGMDERNNELHGLIDALIAAVRRAGWQP